MLKLTKKQYEIEEDIVLNDGENELYRFKMQITSDELNEIKEIIFDEESAKLGRQMSKLEKEDKIEEFEEIVAKVNERALKAQERFEQICFKEHKEPFKEKAGEYKYLEMVEMLFDFFVKTFVDKRVNQMDSMSTNLRKITRH